MSSKTQEKSFARRSKRVMFGKALQEDEAASKEGKEAQITRVPWHPTYGFNPVQVITRQEYKERVMAKIAEDRRKRKGVKLMPEDYAVRLQQLPDRVAAIVGKTFAEMGDSAVLADDEALGMIRDLLLDLDEEIINRNKNKRLARR